MYNYSYQAKLTRGETYVQYITKLCKITRKNYKDIIFGYKIETKRKTRAATLVRTLGFKSIQGAIRFLL